MSYQFNPWNGLDAAIDKAEEKWDARLMPQYIAYLTDQVAIGYARDSEQDFKKLIELNLDLEDLDPPLSSDERHAAKFVIGKIFAANRDDKRRKTKSEEIAMDEIPFAPR